ncbi:MAG: nuclear transport factor 2 family protein [Acidobacteriota bacterium]|nr:nuclear transport factor 2 family protein [Acidobacteriota bacterium]
MLRSFPALPLALLLVILSVRPAPAAEPPDATAQLRELEQVWLRASMGHDRATLDRILDPDFVHIDWQGRLLSKKDTLAAPVSPSTAVQALSQLRVRVYGHTGIVTGLNTITTPAGQVLTGLRFTDVFVERDGLWRAVSAQETVVQTGGRR